MARGTASKRGPVNKRVLELETDRLLLRIAEPSDAAAVLDFRLRNRAFLAPWLPAEQDSAFTLEATVQALKMEYQEFTEGKSFRFLGSLKGMPGRLILDSRFSHVVRGPFQSCYLGYLQDERSCGNGYMQEALEKCIWYMFQVEGIHRIEANIMPRNAPSIRLVKRLGFHPEGQALRYLKINGQWEDHLHYAKLNE